MIRMKGRVVTVTGKDAKALQEAAKLAKQTPRQFLIRAITAYATAALNGRNTVSTGQTQTLTVDYSKKNPILRKSK